jgi:ppGpp synthetase/RelA/SpoT-type nucleotidyltranferase
MTLHPFETILKEFEGKADELEVLEKEAKQLLTDLLKKYQIDYDQITSRIKTKASLTGKLYEKRDYKALDEITDLVGCRIVTYFEDEINQIATIIEKELDVDYPNSSDKRKTDVDRFGYQSLHYVVSIKLSHWNVTQKFEIQIRSMLQHTWAAIQHKVAYKKRVSLSKIAERRFARISALLEIADAEYIALRNELANVVENPFSEDTRPREPILTENTLNYYIKFDQNIIKADILISEILQVELSPEVRFDLKFLNAAEITTANELLTCFQEQFSCITQFITFWLEIDRNALHAYKGSSIRALSYFLIARKRSETEFKKYYTQYAKHKVSGLDLMTTHIYSALEKLDKKCYPESWRRSF